MPAQRQQRNQNNSRIPSPGEDFSDVSPTVDSDDDESVAQTQDDWTFPVVSSKAKREEYEAASEFCCKFLLTDINWSEIVFRLLKMRKSRLANFKIKLSLKNSELRANLRGKKIVGGSRSVLSDHDTLISQQARKFGVMNELFMPSAALMMKRPLTNSMDPARYDSDTAELQGITAEVYESLPDTFYEELEGSIAFQKLVSKFRNKAPHHWSPLVLLLFSSSIN